MDGTPFIGRKKELESLRLLKERHMAALVVIKGRRRIGKSRLIEEFAKDKNFLRFEGIAPTRKTTARMQRAEFARQLHQQLGIPGLEDIQDWGSLFTILAETTKNQEVVILFDEITWMGSKDPVFLGKLKVVWEQYFQKNPNLILILCGSLSTWIEKNIISNTGFFGRISLKLTLDELSLSNCHKLLKARGFKGSKQEELLVLSLTGGVPWYIEQINPSLPASENIRRLCFTPDGLFVEEFKHIFHDLFGKRLSICKKIVTALKDGAKEYDMVAKDINYQSSGSLSEYLDDLITSGFLERDYTWSLQTGTEAKASKYRIKDNYTRYYLKFIAPHLRQIKKGLFQDSSPYALPGWEGVMGLQIENIVLNNRKEVWKVLGIRPEDIIFENPFFQTQTTKRKGCQIDYVIQTRFNTVYLCEIKFSRHPISIKVIEEMQQKMNSLQIPKGIAFLPVLIHTNGVTKAVLEKRFFVQTIDLSSLAS